MAYDEDCESFRESVVNSGKFGYMFVVINYYVCSNKRKLKKEIHRYIEKYVSKNKNVK